MAIEVRSLAIPDVKLITPSRFRDERGFFSDVYNRRELEAVGIAIEFVQDNHSKSMAVGTIRGLHFQMPPCAQVKLIRVISGRVYDVAVDLRRSSPTYGRHVGAELSAENWHQLLIPVGFAHGFCTLEPNTEVGYKTSDYYAPEFERGLLWSDPDLAIDWPLKAAASLKDLDERHPRLKDLSAFFE